MKTTFDLPDALLRQAKAAAAEQGRPLRDLVAEALKDKLAALAAARRSFAEPAVASALEARENSPAPWTSPPLDGREALRAALVLQPDGTYVNVLGMDDQGFFDALDDLRARPRSTKADHLFDDIE
jgi:hypothetical protein